jgi:hypothetical protein
MKPLDLLATVVGILLFGLVALLWYARPGPGLWLLGSVAWAAVTYPAFMYYVTRPK